MTDGRIVDGASTLGGGGGEGRRNFGMLQIGHNVMFSPVKSKRYNEIDFLVSHEFSKTHSTLQVNPTVPAKILKRLAEPGVWYCRKEDPRRTLVQFTLQYLGRQNSAE